MRFPARLLAGLVDLIPVVDLGPYRKFVVAVIGVAVGVLLHFVGPDNEWVDLLVAALTAAGVYETPNATADH